MKILWFTWKDREHPLAGGAEVVNEELATRLAKDGHEVVFVVGGHEGCRPWTERDGITVVRVGGRFSVYWQAYKYYKKYLTDWPDLIIEEVNTVPFFTRLYAKHKRVYFFHQLARQIWFYQMPFPLSLVGYVLEPIYLRFLAQEKTPVITVSESTKHDLLIHGFAEANISIVSEGVEEDPVKKLAPKHAPVNEAPVLLAFGAVRPMKRTLDIVHAFELVKDKCPEATLVIAGDMSGTYGAKVARAAKASAYAEDIHLLGAVTPEQRLEVLGLSTVLLVTSVKEGWGLVVTEAASQGTPAVVYNADGLRDSVRHKVTGLVTAANNPAALAEATLQLISNPDRYERVRRAAWEWSKEITFKKSYKEFAAILKNV